MAKYIEHDHEVVLIPRHISRIGVYTCHIILFSSIISCMYKYYILSILESCLYLTSILHWRKIKHGGIERKLDVFCVILTLSHATYISLQMPLFYTSIWCINLTCSSIIYVKNEYLFFYQVLQFYNKKIQNYNKSFDYFSVEYTNPHTYEREMAYYRNVITHVVFLHIGLCLVSIYCIVHNPL